MISDFPRFIRSFRFFNMRNLQPGYPAKIDYFTVETINDSTSLIQSHQMAFLADFMIVLMIPLLAVPIIPNLVKALQREHSTNPQQPISFISQEALSATLLLPCGWGLEYDDCILHSRIVPWVWH